MDITQNDLLSAGIACDRDSFTFGVPDYLHKDIIAILPLLAHLRYSQARAALERVNLLLDKLIQSSHLGLPVQGH